MGRATDDNEHSMKSQKKINWGIFGTGKIAHDFVTQLATVENANIVGIASRTYGNASTFAQKFGAKAFQSFEELCLDPSIDVVYVALPTRVHMEYCSLVLDHDKALLCEKPFAQNWEQANAIVRKAKQKNLFCMEAMWMRFNPLIARLKKEINSCSIGKVTSVNIALGYRKPVQLLGNYQGATLAFACYGISLVSYLFGPHQRIQHTLLRSNDNLETSGAILFQFADKLIHFVYSQESTLSNEVTIYGTDGFIKVSKPFIDTRHLEVVNYTKAASLGFLARNIKRINTLRARFGSGNQQQPRHTGFKFEAVEVNNCLLAGRKESDVMPLHETLTVQKIMQEVAS